MRVTLCLLFLTGGLAGCLGTANDCTSIEIPSATGGSRFEYSLEADGRHSLEFVGSDQLILDYQMVEPGGPKIGPRGFAQGSRFYVGISETPEPRVDLDGEIAPSWQATYWLHRANTSGPLAIGDEWIRPTDARTMQAGSRSWYLHDDGRTQHTLRLGRAQTPPLMLAPLFWDQSLTRGTEIQLDIPEFFLSPSDFDDGGAIGSLSLEADSLRKVNGVCRIKLTGTYVDPFAVPANGGPPPYVMTLALEFDSTASLPISYEYVVGNETGGSTTKLALQSSTAGLGAKLPSFHAEQWPPPGGLARVPRDDGFLAGRDLGFPTSYDEAVAAMRADRTFAQWASDHAGAVPADVSHVIGAAGSGVQDAWRITWSDGGASLEASAIQQTAFAGLVEPPIMVSTTPAATIAAPTGSESWPTLQSLDAISQNHFLQPLQNFTCHLAASLCLFGEQAPASVSLSLGNGMMVWLARGWVIQESSTNVAAVRLPVPYHSPG